MMTIYCWDRQKISIEERTTGLIICIYYYHSNGENTELRKDKQTDDFLITLMKETKEKHKYQMLKKKGDK